MTKAQILRKLFVAVSAYFIIFGFIVGFVAVVIIFYPLPVSIFVGFTFVHAGVATFFGIVSGFILCGICWVAFLPPRNRLILRIIFALMTSGVVVWTYLLFTNFRDLELIGMVISSISLVSSQLVVNYYLKLVSTLKIKRKNKDI